MKLNIILTVILYLGIHHEFSDVFGEESPSPSSEVALAISRISEVKKDGNIYKFYKKGNIPYFFVKREGVDEDEELCSFTQGVSLAYGDDVYYRLVDVLEYDDKITLLMACPNAYGLLTVTKVNKIPKGKLILGLKGMVNEKWVVTARVHETTFEPRVGGRVWEHDEFYQYAKLVSHEEFKVKEKDNDQASIYKMTAKTLLKDGVVVQNTGNPFTGLIDQEDLHKIHTNLMADPPANSEIIKELERAYGGKDRYLELFTQMDDPAKAAELKDRINAAYTNSENNK